MADDKDKMYDATCRSDEERLALRHIVQALRGYRSIDNFTKKSAPAARIYELPSQDKRRMSSGPTFILLDIVAKTWTCTTSRRVWDQVFEYDLGDLDVEDARRLKALVVLGLLTKEDHALFLDWRARRRTQFSAERDLAQLERDAKAKGYRLVKIEERPKSKPIVYEGSSEGATKTYGKAVG